MFERHLFPVCLPAVLSILGISNARAFQPCAAPAARSPVRASRTTRDARFEEATTGPLSLSAASWQDGSDAVTAGSEAEEAGGYGYHEVSGFFNVREANANVEQGEWEVEVTGEWSTHSDGSDDDFGPSLSLKYGITNDCFAELEVLHMNVGDGGDQGNGDLDLTLFYQLLHETGATPALATWAEMRIPSGEGSSGVDGELHASVTKTFMPRVRGHIEGWVESANGSRGEEEDRSHFQWGIGPGFDYQFSDRTIGVINYLHRSSEDEDGHNNNILEVGFVHELTPHQHLKFDVDIGLDGQESTPNLAARLQWSLDWH